MRIALCTLCLNEEEFLSRSYEQHKNWPDLAAWIFVEAADVKYAEANPQLVTPEGLSVDRTGEFLDSIFDRRVRVDHYGWMRDHNVALSKTIGRDRYLAALEEVQPDFFVVIDADEFYTHEDQLRINETVARAPGNTLGWRFVQRHLWRPPAIEGDPRFDLEVTGGYWNVPHIRVFRWVKGLRYRTDHNWPIAPGYRVLNNFYEGTRLDPQCIHLGFTRAGRERKATNNYYRQRGEGRGDGRGAYVQCRGAWETWRPGMKLPRGVRVREYDGPVPECWK